MISKATSATAFVEPDFFASGSRFDCGSPRCRLCHFDKFYVRKARARKRRAAIEFEFDAIA